MEDESEKAIFLNLKSYVTPQYQNELSNIRTL